MKCFGASNWTLARVEEANAWAKQNGKIGFAAVSNNFSLARMVDPVWGGCVAASDPQSRDWFTRTQLPLMSWSSQARGFFLPDRAHPGKKDDPDLVRCWYSPDNFARLWGGPTSWRRKNASCRSTSPWRTCSISPSRHSP